MCETEPVQFVDDNRLVVRFDSAGGATGKTCEVEPTLQVVDLRTLKRTPALPQGAPQMLPRDEGWSGRPVEDDSDGWVTQQCGWRNARALVSLPLCLGDWSVPQRGGSTPRRPQAVSLAQDTLLVLATRKLTFESSRPRSDVVVGSVDVDGPGIFRVRADRTVVVTPRPELQGFDHVVGVFDDGWLLLSGSGKFALVRVDR